jgi:two-component system, LytTR family, sensor kinase
MAATWEKVSNIGRAYLWSFLVWGAFAPIMAAQNKVLFLSDNGVNVSYWKLLLIALAWCTTSAILTPPLFYIVQRHPISRAMGVGRIIGYVAGAPVYVMASASLRTILLPPWDPSTQEFTHRNFQTLLDNIHLFAMQTWDYAVILVCAHAFAYIARARKQEIEGARLQQALAESELQVLKSQLQPHFLFNTLHGISTLIEVDKARAKLMVLKLSNLLRAVLADGTADLIALRDELKFAEAYLDIEKMRLGDRLEIRWKIQAGNGQMLVPPLILQPLVENAIAHGVACSREGGWLEIGLRNANNGLEMSVRNSVCEKSTPGSGLGLRNVRARLNHLYSDEAKFSLEISKDGVATATVVLPALGTKQSEMEESTGTAEAKSA